MKYLGLFLYELIDLAPPPSKVALKTQAIVAHCQQSYKCSGDQVIVLAREGAQQKSEQTVEFHEVHLVTKGQLAMKMVILEDTEPSVGCKLLQKWAINGGLRSMPTWPFKNVYFLVNPIPLYSLVSVRFTYRLRVRLTAPYLHKQLSRVGVSKIGRGRTYIKRLVSFRMDLGNQPWSSETTLRLIFFKYIVD